MNGATPRPIDDEPSAAIAIGLGPDLRTALARHIQDDFATHVGFYKRFAKLDNLRFYAMGMIAILGGIAGFLFFAGPYFMRLAVTDVVAPAMRAQAVADREYIGVRLDQFKASVDEANREAARAAAELGKRIDAIEARRRRQ
jgi:hypothetical protein